MPDLIRDIIIISVIAIVVVSLLILGIKNNSKIKKNLDKKTETIRQEPNIETQKPQAVQEKPKQNSVLDNVEFQKGNYLHDRFNSGVKPTDTFYYRNGNVYETNEHRRQELSEQETEQTLKKLKDKRTRDFYDYNPNLDTASGAVRDIDSREYADYEEDYNVSIDSEYVTSYDNNIADEFKNLSPSMKAMMVTNVLDKKDEE